MAARGMARLSRSFRVVSVRYVAGGGEGLEEIAADAAAWLRALGEGPAVVIGESFGSLAAIQLALDFPMVVAAGGLVNGFARYPRRWRLWTARWVSAVLGGAGCRQLRRRYGARRLLGPRWRLQLAREIESHSPAFDALYRARLRMISRVDLRPRLGEIAQPFTLFASCCDAVAPSVECAREMAARMRDARVQLIHDAGHSVLGLDELPWPEWVADLCERGGSGGGGGAER
jgi:pimeloyl-ACP methyl ester carboxylesterase